MSKSKRRKKTTIYDYYSGSKSSKFSTSEEIKEEDEEENKTLLETRILIINLINPLSDGNELSTSEINDNRIDRVNYYVKFYSVDEFREKKIRPRTRRSLQEIYSKVNPNNRIVLSKIALVDEISSMFFNISSPLQKRNEEKENIKTLEEIESDEDFKFLSFSNILIPDDVLQIILKFLPRNYDLLVNFGGSCKQIYLKLLKSWEKVFVNQKNCRSISLLALKNISEVEIDGLIIPDLEYLFLNVSKKLRRIRLHGDLKYIKTVIICIQDIQLRARKKMNIRNNLNNVNSFLLESKFKSKFHSIYGPLPKDFKELKISSLYEIFPKLKGFGIKFCSSLFDYRLSEFQLLMEVASRISSLKLSIFAGYNFSQVLSTITESRLYNPKKSFLNVKTLVVWKDPSNSSFQGFSTFFDFINIFKNLKILRVVSEKGGSFWNHGDGDFDLAKFSGLKFLKKLVIREKKDFQNSFPKLRKKNGGISHHIPVLCSGRVNIHQIQIYSSLDPFTVSCLDFNMESFLEFSENINTKILSFSVPLYSREKNLEFEGSEEGCSDENLEIKNNLVSSSFELLFTFMKDRMINFDFLELEIHSFDPFFCKDYVYIHYKNYGGIRKLEIQYGAYEMSYERRHIAIGFLVRKVNAQGISEELQKDMLENPGKHLPTNFVYVDGSHTEIPYSRILNEKGDVNELLHHNWAMLSFFKILLEKHIGEIAKAANLDVFEILHPVGNVLEEMKKPCPQEDENWNDEIKKLVKDLIEKNIGKDFENFGESLLFTRKI